MLQSFDPRNRDIRYSVNGRLLHRDVPGISPFDSAVQGGDAVWEGLRVYDGRVFRLRDHLDRLARSARSLGFSEIPTHERIIEDIRRTLSANGMRDGVHIRLTLTRGVKITSGMDPRLNTSGPTLIVLAEHKPPVYDTNAGLRLITASIRRPSPDVLDPKIHHNNLLNSILAKMEASAAGADDAVMLDSRGFVAETNATHLFLVACGGGGDDAGVRSVVQTPRCVACPEGITRAAVLEICGDLGIAAEERDLSLAEFFRASECFCTGTMGEIAWVREIDGRRIGSGSVGSVTRRLQVAFRELTRTSGEHVVD